MKIIIYETTHFENLSALLELCAEECQQITLFLTQFSYEQIQPTVQEKLPGLQISYYVQASNEHNRKYIRRFFHHLATEEYTHLHINTLDHNVLYFTWLLLRHCRKIAVSMTVHSINDYRTFSFRSLKGISESIAKFILHQKIKHYRVLAPAMVDYFQSYFPSKNIVFIPGNFFDKNFSKKFQNYNEAFTITVPGTIESKRRDYHLLIRFFTQNLLWMTRFRRVQLVLAGSARLQFGKDVVRQLEALQNDGFSVKFFESEISTAEYNYWFYSSDIVWNPIKFDTIGLDNTSERSSISLSPGFITDQIRLGRPGIIPATVQVHEKLKDCNFYYQTEDDLREIFQKILSDYQYLDEKKRLTASACQHFSVANYKNSFKILTS